MTTKTFILSTINTIAHRLRSMLPWHTTPRVDATRLWLQSRQQGARRLQGVSVHTLYTPAAAPVTIATTATGSATLLGTALPSAAGTRQSAASAVAQASATLGTAPADSAAAASTAAHWERTRAALGIPGSVATAMPGTPATTPLQTAAAALHNALHTADYLVAHTFRQPLAPHGLGPLPIYRVATNTRSGSLSLGSLLPRRAVATVGSAAASPSAPIGSSTGWWAHTRMRFAAGSAVFIGLFSSAAGLAGFGIGAGAGAAACTAAGCHTFVAAMLTQSFEECAAAGYPVAAGDPPRCIIGRTTYTREPEHVQVARPGPSSIVSSGFTLQGRALAVGNTVRYTLVDTHGAVLAQGQVPTTSTDHGAWGDYETTIAYTAPGTPLGQLSVYDGSVYNDKITVVTRRVCFADSTQGPLCSRLLADAASSTSAPGFTTGVDPVAPRPAVWDPLATAPATLPAAASLPVPFISQAPLYDWSEPYNEACEEASIIMVDHYLQQQPLDKEIGNTTIVLTTQWQADNGYQVDLGVDDMATFIQGYYGYETRVYRGEQVTADLIRRLIAAGHPVIIPAAGRLLANPHYTGLGPPYHVLVITGYNDTQFITNDPGTSHGEAYAYSQATVMDAIHDWTGSTRTIETGGKALIVLRPQA